MKAAFLLFILLFSSTSRLVSQSDTLYFFDFENLQAETDAGGNVIGSILHNGGEFQDARPFDNLTVAYGNRHSYKNAEYGNYSVGKQFLYHSPSWFTSNKTGVSFNHIELTLDAPLTSDGYYKFSFLVANMKSHRFKPAHYGIKFSRERIIKESPGALLSEPDMMFSFSNDDAFEEIVTVVNFDQPVKYIYFGLFLEDSTRVPKKFPTESTAASYSDTAEYVLNVKPTRVMLDNILIERLHIVNKQFNNIYYEPGIDEMENTEDYEVIHLLAESLKENPNTSLLVKGSTDRAGSLIYNLDLSRRRAEKIKEILIAEGIDKKRIITIGNGIGQTGNTKDDAKNARSVSFVLFY
jgi:outer membrane protein OmpA-like peptidoglycan-associated protein